MKKLILLIFIMLLSACNQPETTSFSKHWNHLNQTENKYPSELPYCWMTYEGKALIIKAPPDKKACQMIEMKIVPSDIKEGIIFDTEGRKGLVFYGDGTLIERGKVMRLSADK